MMKLRIIVVCAAICCPLVLLAQTTQPADDAAKLYLKAADLITANYAKNIQCPAASNSEWPHSYPPYPQDWQSMEETDFDANADARQLAHQARSIDHAHWPERGIEHDGASPLNLCRALSNELADASNYQLTLKNYSAAIEILRDQWHLADSLENQGDKIFIRLLVSIGIRDELMDRFQTLTAYAAFTNDPKNLRDIQVGVARDWIRQLLDHAEAKTQMNDYLEAEHAAKTLDHKTQDELLGAIAFTNTEREMAAMSLACHIYHFDTGKWPASLDDLHAYLPKMPIDPWGDGKQTLGYALVKGGLPTGEDRPLVYSRYLSKDGMFFRTDQAAYSCYGGDGSNLPPAKQKEGGQFRDVAGWIVPDGINLSPATAPLSP